MTKGAENRKENTCDVLCVICDEKEGGFEAVIREICSGIRVDWKVSEVVKGPCNKWC